MIDITSLLSTDGYIMCNKTLIKLFGGDCAILIGELCAEYNYYKNLGELTSEDSFYSTQANIEENTGLNEYAQRKALNSLKAVGIIQVTRQGLPAKNYYWINQNKLLEIFSTSSLNFKEQDVQNLNLNNNKEKRINKNNTISKDIVQVEPDILETNQSEYESHAYSDFELAGKKPKRKSLVEKPKKISLYDKCLALIDQYDIDDEILKQLLRDYLPVRLAMKDKQLCGVNQWKGMLNKLTLMGDNYKQREIVKQSIERGWASFFDIQDSSKPTKQAWNRNVQSVSMTDADAEQFEKEIEERKRNGKRVSF